MPRYKVATSEGWQIKGPSGRSNKTPGVTASVLDTHRAHREVKRFRSEERSWRITGPVARRRETMRLAEEYAATLNAADAAKRQAPTR